jgi:hypothetical protein
MGSPTGQDVNIDSSKVRLFESALSESDTVGVANTTNGLTGPLSMS